MYSSVSSVYSIFFPKSDCFVSLGKRVESKAQYFSLFQASFMFYRSKHIMQLFGAFLMYTFELSL